MRYNCPWILLKKKKKKKMNNENKKNVMKKDEKKIENLVFVCVWGSALTNNQSRLNDQTTD